MKSDIERLQKKLIERNSKESNKKKHKFSDLDKYVIFSLTSVIIFTIIAIIYQWFHDMELSSTLITCFFACFGGELLMLCMIKRLKLKKGEEYNDERHNI